MQPVIFGMQVSPGKFGPHKKATFLEPRRHLQQGWSLEAISLELKKSFSPAVKNIQLFLPLKLFK